MRQHERGPAFGWPDTALTLLKTRWAEGASASTIAAELGQGVSRNAVLGKISRLKLQRRDVKAAHPFKARKANEKRHGNFQQPKANAIVAKALQRQVPAFPVEPFDMEDGEPVDVTHLVGLMDLERTSCRWPMGSATGSAQLFCGKHAAAGSYCSEHTKRASYGFGNGARP